MGIGEKEIDGRVVQIKVREANYRVVRRDDARLNELYGSDRPKCRICGGRLDKPVPFTRCPFCGAPEACEVGV